jgi:hypothetical protein
VEGGDKFTFKAGSRIRLMEYPEISRFNGWSSFTGTKKNAEASFVKKINNKPQYTGAFFFDQWPGFGDGNASFITWAFFEEILINQFFAPIVSGDNKTPNPADIMLLRSCNIIESDGGAKFKHYDTVAKKNKWIRGTQGMSPIFYESVRIGFNEHLRSIDGGVLWIPGYPEPNANDSQTKPLRDSYDEFQCSKFGGPESANSLYTDKDKEEGYLRNLMINTSAVKEAFANANTVEDGIGNLLGKMNSASCDYWNLTIQCDENDGGTRLKVIDSNWVEKSVEEIKKTAGSSAIPSLEDTTFRFPIYSNNTISSGVNMSSQLPDSLKAAIFVGKNKYKKNWHSSGEEEIPVFTDDVIDRYHHFGPYTKKGVTEEEEKEAKAQKKLAEEKEKEAIEDAKEDLGDVEMTSKVQQATASYIKSLLYTDPSPYNQYRNNRMIPVNLSLDLDGIGGIYFGNVFTVSKLPDSLDDRLLFQVKNVTHTVNNDNWKVAIESFCRIGDKTQSSDNQEHFLNQERNKSKADSANKYQMHEEARKKKQKELNDANKAAEAETNQSGNNTKASEQSSTEAKAASAKDSDLRSKINVSTTTNAGETDSRKTRKSGKDTHVILPVKKEIVVVSDSELTPAKLEEQAAATEATERNIPIMTPWFTNDELPAITGLGDLGLEDVTFFSEQEENSKAYNVGTEISSHTQGRDALVLSAHSAVYRLDETSTGDAEILIILRAMEKYKQDGLLLMWLQVFHLHFINADFGDKPPKGYNGNIFKWAKYEATFLDDPTAAYAAGTPGFKTLLGWDGTSEYGSPGGIQFFEMGTTEPIHWNKRGEGDTGIYHYSQKKSDKNIYGTKQLDNTLFYNDPEWHPWGPQWFNERGFYYIAGEPGVEEPTYSSNI